MKNVVTSTTASPFGAYAATGSVADDRRIVRVGDGLRHLVVGSAVML